MLYMDWNSWVIYKKKIFLETYNYLININDKIYNVVTNYRINQEIKDSSNIIG